MFQILRTLLPLAFAAWVFTAAVVPAAAQSSGPLPEVAVDDAIVAQQQEEVRKACVEDNSSIPKGVDCNCLASNYPEFRKRKQQEGLAALKARRDATCALGTAAGECAQLTESLAKISDREFEIHWFPGQRPPNPRRPDKTAKLDLGVIYLDLAAKCKDGAALAKRVETECLASNGAPAGKSKETYCSCLAGYYRKGFEQDKRRFDSNLDVELKTGATVACSR